MRLAPIRPTLLLAAVVGSVIPASAAQADELLVMPYSCTMIAGRPMLRPAQQQGHRVIGARVERVFRACSPANPGFCRQWTVHRFEFDCGGSPAPWIVAVAAAEEARGDVWLQDGRLHLRMPPDWSMAPDDPCAAAFQGGERWRQRRLSRYCAERAAIVPPPVVAFPATFAPTLGIDAIFVPAPVAQSQPRTLDQASGAGAKVTEAPAARMPEPGPKVAAAQEQAPSAARKAVESGADPWAVKPAEATPKVAVTPEPPPPSKKPSDGQASPPRASAPASGPPNVKIINRDWESAPAQGESKAAPASAGQQPAGRTDSAPSGFAEPRVKADARLVTGSTSKAEPSALAPEQHGLSPSLTAISIGLGLLMLSIGLAIALARRREHAELAAATSRDIATVAFAGESARRALTVLQGKGQGAPKTAIPPELRPAATVVGSGRMPETREEALQVLGMGVAGDTGLPAIKKVVDGLRMSWHPDYAIDRADREARELRLKQINAAWQVLGGNRAA
jgi:hypothetical protein